MVCGFLVPRSGAAHPGQSDPAEALAGVAFFFKKDHIMYCSTVYSFNFFFLRKSKVYRHSNFKVLNGGVSDY